MKVIRTDQEIEDIEDDALRRVIRQRATELLAYVEHFAELVRFVVAGEGDDRTSIEAELGVELTKPPDAVEEVAGYIERVYVLSDDGSGVTLFLPLSMSQLLSTGAEVGRPT